jgi:hypothetical protein
MKTLQHGCIAFVLTVLAPAQTHGGQEGEIPNNPPGTAANQVTANKQDRWLDLIIPEFVIEESGTHVLATLSDEIKRLDGEALGFSAILFDSKIAEAEIKQKTTLKEIPVRVLIAYICDQIKGTWAHYSGRLWVDRFAPDLGHSIRIDPDFLKMFRIEPSENREQDLTNLLERLNEMGSLLKTSNFEWVIKDSYSVWASPREIEYFQSLIRIQERGHSVNRVEQ